MPTYGVALIDESRESGWACLGDARTPQEPFRFEHPGDLRNDCIWLVSAESFSPYRGSHHLRPDDYFSTKLKYLAADYGVRVDGRGRMNEVALQACRTLSTSVNAAMLMAAQCYPWRAPAQALKGDHLWKDIRKVLPAPPEVEPYVLALKSAYQGYSRVASPYAQDHDVYMTLRVNRLEHAKRVMATRVPDVATMRTYPGGNVPMEYLLDPSRSCLVRATIEFNQTDPALARLVAFGEGMGARQGLRQWISQPELRWLHQYATVHIETAVVAEASVPIPATAQLPPLLVSDPVFALSLPVGLVAETHWHALAEQPWSPRFEDKLETTLWATWLRAEDRAACFELALSAMKVGYRVTGYGNGSVNVSINHSQLPELCSWAYDNGIDHPAFEPLFREYGLVS